MQTSPEHVVSVRERHLGLDTDTGVTRLASAASAERPARAPRIRRDWRHRTTWEEAYVALHASVHCNMACRYCQASGVRRSADTPSMDVGTAQQAMGWAVRDFATRAPRITFAYGISGEPLLHWDDFVQLHAYGRQLAEETGKAITWGINTNALLLSQDVIEFVADAPDVCAAISIDGPPEAHNAMRRLLTGRGTYDAVAQSIERVRRHSADALHGMHAVATLSAEYPHPDRVLLHLIGLDLHHISITPVRAAPGVEYGVNAQTVRPLQEGYSDLAQLLFRSWRCGTGTASCGRGAS